MRPRLHDQLRFDSAFWRRALALGIEHGPTPWLRYSPPLFGLAFAAGLQGPREAVRQSLRRVRGESSPWREAYEVGLVFANFASAMTDALIASGRPEFEVRVDAGAGTEALQSCLDKGRGVILAVGSTAGWDLAGHVAGAKFDTDVMVVMGDADLSPAMRMHDEMRERAGVQVMRLGADPMAALPLLSHLRAGKMVATKFDRHGPTTRCRDVSFFGEPWKVPEGPLRLAALSGAPVLPFLTRRLGFLHYEFLHADPIYVPRRPDEQQLDAAAQTLATLLETFVRDNPTQWFRFHEEP
ncbi:MAG: lysophospholipid acyltransferase family protein [Polyangiaceae bacterium]